MVWTLIVARMVAVSFYKLIQYRIHALIPAGPKMKVYYLTDIFIMGQCANNVWEIA